MESKGCGFHGWRSLFILPALIEILRELFMERDFRERQLSESNVSFCPAVTEKTINLMVVCLVVLFACLYGDVSSGTTEFDVLFQWF